MKKWYITLLVVIASTFIIGQVCKMNFFPEGSDALKTQEDTLNKGFGVEYAINDDYSQTLIDYADQYDDMVDSSEIIIIGKPTGRVFQQGEYFAQEVEIDHIIKGNDELEANNSTECFYAFSVDGFQDYERDGRIKYLGGRGLMQKDSSYLIFLRPVSDISIMPVGGYELVGGFFSYIKLDSDDSRSQPVTAPVNELKYDDVWQFEYIAESEKILENMYRMKKHIIESVL
jgi:hypothetical protein